MRFILLFPEARHETKRNERCAEDKCVIVSNDYLYSASLLSLYYRPLCTGLAAPVNTNEDEETSYLNVSSPYVKKLATNVTAITTTGRSIGVSSFTLLLLLLHNYDET